MKNFPSVIILIIVIIVVVSMMTFLDLFKDKQKEETIEEIYISNISHRNVKPKSPIIYATAEYIPSELKSQFFNNYESPSGSICASTLFDVNIEIVKKDPMKEVNGLSVEKIEDKFVFNENRKFGSIGEKLSCKILEEFLKREVILHLRPNFLKNPDTKRNLEIDMYDPHLKLGLEYNGKQHYSDVPFFHNSSSDFNKQKFRDELKIKLCEKEGITLIIIPYTIDSTTIDKNGKIKQIKRSEEDRELRLKNFILPKLEGLVR
jgi:hypothetical protein